MLTTPGPQALADDPITTSPTAAVVTIDPKRFHQTMEGFGAATAFYQNWITAHPNKTALYELFFKGLNLSILRLQNGYRPTKGPDFARDEQEIVRNAALVLKHPIPILMSSWSPPADLKNTHDEKHGGTLASENGKIVYGKFADYWADSLMAYKKIGIVPTWISIQNEPDWKADWESCLFKPQETTEDGVTYAGYDQAVTAVARRIQSVPGAPKLLGPETLGIGYQSVQNYLSANNGAAARPLYGIAHHLYSGGDHQSPDTFIPALHSVRDMFPNKPHWMTEFGRSDGFQTAWCIHNCLTEENATAYIYWAGIWPGDDALIHIDNPFERNSWKLPNGMAPTDRYFGLKHFSYFIRPGYRRIDASVTVPALKVSAFLSPDGTQLVLVALNTSTTTPASLTLSPQGLSSFAHPRASALYRSVLPPPAITPTTGERVGTNRPGERFKFLGSLRPGSSISLPPRSIITLVLNQK
jgi:glucuronoarabinoxylan endo-1,4-beta-xylanase